MQKKNVQKRKARPERSIDKPGRDHELGLWIDKDLLSKHRNRTPQTIIHDQVMTANNRYLALADIALKTRKDKRKALLPPIGGQ